MKITNHHNLPGPIVRAVSYDTHGPRHGDITVTELIKPPQMLELERQHDHELTEDASERLYALDGSAIHAVLSWARVPNALQEERLSIQVRGGWTVTGTPDLYEADGTLSDFKRTSVWVFVHGIRPEWVAQLNLYALLLRENGFPVSRLQIVPLLRDWDEEQALKEARNPYSTYPPAPSLCHPIALWDHSDAWHYLERRVELHQRARLHKHWPPCSPEERWRRGESWAVYEPLKRKVKVGGEVQYGKRAAAVFGPDEKRGGAEPEAELFAEKGNGRIEYRPGRFVRCERYCSVRAFCPQLKQEAQKHAEAKVVTA